MACSRHQLFLLSLVLLFACSDSKETRLQRYLIQGNEKIKEREYAQAEKYLKEALRLDSCFADALNNLGTVAHRRENKGLAVDYYSEAIRCNADFYPAYFNRANVYYEIGNFDGALADLEIIGKRFPDTLVMHQLRALVYWKKYDYPMARENFVTMKKNTPDDPNILINIGTIFSMEKNFDSARFYLNKALTLSPEEPNAFNALAMLEADAGNAAESRKWMDKALALAPEDAYTLNNDGYLLLLEGKHAEALERINASIATDPYNSWAYRNKGLYFLKRGELDEALLLFKRAEEGDERVDKLYAFMAEAYAGKNDQARSCEYYKKAVALGQVNEDDVKKKCGS